METPPSGADRLCRKIRYVHEGTIGDNEQHQESEPLAEVSQAGALIVWCLRISGLGPERMAEA